METLRRLDECVAKVGRATTVRFLGRVTDVVGVVIESEGPNASIGDVCLIRSQSGHSAQEAEVVGIRGHKVLLMALGELNGIGPGSVVVRKRQQFTTPVGAELLGRVIDGLGRPIDNKGPLRVRQRRSIYQPAPDPLSRRRVERPLATGIRAIDALLTCGEGQRMGIFSGSGVGKSVLLGMIARNTDADVNVIGLIGERGREVRDFLERDLGEQGLRRSVVVVVTGDQAALLRVKGALVATTIAEYFRDQGLRVMLMMDSITRVAMAQREIGLSVGEPPTTRGYTPSVFAFLPKLLERAGNTQCGSITGLYTVLVEGDDLNEPVSDAVRAILDGHVVLSRRLANVNHYPAIDVLASTSRVMIDVVSREHLEAARKVVEILSVYREAEDLINIGAYVPGSNRKVDYARSMIERVNAFLRQGIDERVDFARAVQELKALVG
ncbi:MAG: flagellar protein export ATPase FliI [candidate division KSB1 bacterium]|nr:flagellar protein export ATPase FliI [candidate division KSB1 bacterium]MDZ7392625.1 flagellar protein export ATPase FliI [candidate division KSB1 bacterium]